MSNESLGSIPVSWNICRLDELAEIIDSLHKTPAYSDIGYPMVRVTDINNVALDLSSTLRVSAEIYSEFTRRYAPKRNDIVMSRVGTYGNTCYVDTDEPFCLGQNTVLISPLINPRYLYFCLRSPLVQNQIESLVVGSTQKTISLKSLGSLQIPTPPTEEMDEIAHILGSLDDKIDLNRRMNATLESMARALFKSWFVNFDPVRARAEGRQPDGIDTDTAALFPDSFEDSTLGPIPFGWNIAPLSEHIEAERGLSYNGDGLSDQSAGLPMHNLNSIYEGGGYKYEGIKYYTGNYQERHVAKAGDLIIANTEQGHFRFLIGYPALIPNRYPMGLFSHHLYKVSSRGNSHMTTRYLYFLFRTRRFHDLISGYSNGTTVNMLPSDSLERPKFVVPPAKIVARFDEITQPILDKLDKSYSETLNLSATRDALLPRLMSGQPEVKTNL